MVELHETDMALDRAATTTSEMDPSQRGVLVVERRSHAQLAYPATAPPKKAPR
jgi:hypothetical protein